MADPAVSLFEVILALHILAVVVAFGVAFAWPIIYGVIARVDPRALPAIVRAERAVEAWLGQPAMVVVLGAGIYLASKLHVWSDFFVQWGIGAIVVIGAIMGAVMAPAERKLPEVIERDLQGSGEGAPSQSPEQLALTRRLQIGGSIASTFVVVTIVLMVFQVS